VKAGLKVKDEEEDDDGDSDVQAYNSYEDKASLD